MKAVGIEQFGGPEVLRWADVPDPAPGFGEVVVDIVGAGVNRADLLQRRGLYPPPPGESEILGLECSGRVSAVGHGVTSLAVGDEICALLAGGGYAEKVSVPEGQCMPVPAGVELATAGALPEVACTVHANLVRTANLQPGETVLIHGGAGGIGTFAIQYAVALGAKVAATAGSPEKVELCRRLGADITVDYRQQDFVEVVGQADVILDNMGAKYLSRNIEVLAPDGRLVVVGLQGGTSGEMDLGALMTKRGAVYATSLRSRSRAQKAAICAEVTAQVWPLIEESRIRLVLDRTYPPAEAADAHRRLESGEHTGKVLLTARPNDPPSEGKG